LLSGLKALVEKLPSFVGGAIDFGALAGATIFAKMLAHGGYPHAEGIQKEKITKPSVLGDTSDLLRKSVHNFMSTIWVFFGRAAAKQMADDRRVEVHALLYPLAISVLKTLDSFFHVI
jgi:hypothetical protein